MLRLVPGTVVEQMIGDRRHRQPGHGGPSSSGFFGLDQPWWLQYFALDRPPSRRGEPRDPRGRTGKAGGSRLILERLAGGRSRLTLLSVGFAAAAGPFPAGNPLGRPRRDQMVDKRGRASAPLLGLSVPVFWQGHDADPLLLDLPALDGRR